jgi:serine/threonine protein kinase
LGIQKLDDLLDYLEDNEHEKFFSMFKIKRVLGSGGFGVVLQAVDVQFRKNVALKVVLKNDIKGEMLMYEYEILK